MPVVKHPDSIVFSVQNVPPIKFCRDFMVSCEISSPGLQLLSQLAPREVFTQAPRLVGQLSHRVVFVVLPCFSFGSHVVTHLTVVSAPCCQR